METKFQFILVFLIFIGCATQSISDEGIDQRQIERLIEGNNRYVRAQLRHPHQSASRIREISTEQRPFAVVVSCSDSRVPPEIIFDQGLGDLFVIRTAGNVIGDYELASIEYAVLKLECKVIVITGHDECGAIQVFMEQSSDSLPGHLDTLVSFIGSQPNASILLNEGIDKSYQAVIGNIIFGVNFIKEKSTVIRQKFENKELELYGAVYHIESGKVHIIEDDIKR